MMASRYRWPPTLDCTLTLDCALTLYCTYILYTLYCTHTLYCTYILYTALILYPVLQVATACDHLRSTIRMERVEAGESKRRNRISGADLRQGRVRVYVVIDSRSKQTLAYSFGPRPFARDESAALGNRSYSLRLNGRAAIGADDPSDPRDPRDPTRTAAAAVVACLSVTLRRTQLGTAAAPAPHTNEHLGSVCFRNSEWEEVIVERAVSVPPTDGHWGYQIVLDHQPVSHEGDGERIHALEGTVELDSFLLSAEREPV
jgi:hypothetical protein